MKRIDEPSIVQSEKRCWLCGGTGNLFNPLERHEAFGAANRKQSIDDGLTVLLCGETCHRNGPNAIHNHRGNRLRLQAEAQQAYMDHTGATADEFKARYGKNYL